MKQHLLTGMIASTLAAPVYAVEINEQLEVFGTLELEYANRSNKVDDGTGTITTEKEIGTAVKSAQLGAKFKPNQQIDFTVSGLYEEDLHHVITPLEWEQAFATWHVKPEGKLDITAGNQYLPFGKFDTQMAQDPVTLDFGQAWNQHALTASSKMGKITTSAFAFTPKAKKVGSDEKQRGAYGFGVNYADEDKHAAAGVEYLSNLTESGGFADFNNSSKKIPAIAIHGSKQLGRVTLVGEHILATKSFQAGDLADANGNSLSKASKPSATHLEADIDLNKERVLAVAWEGTHDAEEQIGLSKQSYGVTYRQPLYKNVTGAVELRESKDYANLKSKALTAVVAYEF